MSATVHLPAHSWDSTHNVLLTVVAIALALAVALTITLVVSRATNETIAPGGSVTLNPGERLGPVDTPVVLGGRPAHHR
jgi:hypothetical protein